MQSRHDVKTKRGEPRETASRGVAEALVVSRRGLPGRADAGARGRRGCRFRRSSRCAIVKPKTTRGCPPGAHTAPAAPLMSAGCAARARPAKVLATACAPRISGASSVRPCPALCARTDGYVVGAEHDVRVEHREQRVEVAAARGGEEGVDDCCAGGRDRRRGPSPLPAPGGGRGWRAAGPRSGSAPRWARSRRRARRTGRAARTRAARREPACRAPRAARGRPSRPAALRARGRSRPRGSTIGSARCAPSGSSRRDLRERSMSRQTRATTVVSQPPRFSTPLVSARLSRSQASCTASSASLSEPSIR